MPSDRIITIPGKTSETKPCKISPQKWNAMVDAQEAMLAMIKANIVQSGADIGVRKTTSGVVPFLKRHNSSQAGSTVKHQWKTTDAGIIEEVQSYNVKGGLIWDHIPSGISEESEFYDPIIVPDAVVALAVGIIYLEIQRDSTTRKVTAYSISGAEGTISEETGLLSNYNILPSNGPDYQYIALSIVGTTPKIIQLQFQEIKVFEMLIVSNGEFKLGNFQMMGQTNYALPEVSPEPEP